MTLLRRNKKGRYSDPKQLYGLGLFMLGVGMGAIMSYIDPLYTFGSAFYVSVSFIIVSFLTFYLGFRREKYVIS